MLLSNYPAVLVWQVLRGMGYSRVVDMTGHERYDRKYFEGTGGLCYTVATVTASLLV